MATLAQQSIEQSIIEESEERARNGGSRTLAHHALDQEAVELKLRGMERRYDEYVVAANANVCDLNPGDRSAEPRMRRLYRGPTEASYRPRPSPWWFRGDRTDIFAIAFIATILLLVLTGCSSDADRFAGTALDTRPDVPVSHADELCLAARKC